MGNCDKSSAQNEKNEFGLLRSYRVIDLTDDAVSLCGMILGGLGAEVIKVEKPGGDNSRKIPPFYHDISDNENSLYWFAANANKKGIVLDIENGADKDKLKRLVSTSDFLIESFEPGYMASLGLSYSDLTESNPGLIMLSVSPFGQTGPYSSYKGSNLIAEAMGGLAFCTGHSNERPVASGFQLAYRYAGLQTALSALIANHYKQKTGKGQYVDLSIQESVVNYLQLTPYLWFYANKIQHRAGPKTIWGERDGLSQVVYPCKDGHILWRMYTGGLGWQTANLANWMAEEGMSEGLEEIDWPQVDMSSLTAKQMAEWENVFAKFFLTKTKKDLYPVVVEKGIMVFPLYNSADILLDEQIQHRNFWRNVEHEQLKDKITYPGVPLQSSEVEFQTSRPPGIGEHTDDILAKLDELIESKKNSESRSNVNKEKDIEGNDSALGGLNIIDLGWVFAGPFISRYLGDFGATVVKVETNTRVDPLRTMSPYAGGKAGLNRGAYFLWHSPNKHSIAIDFNNKKGLKLFKKLVAWADVLVENFTPGTLEQLGLGYDELKAINPKLVLVRLSAVGQEGPFAQMRGLGQMLKGLTGLANTGLPGDIPTPNPIAHTDYIASAYFSIAALAALDHMRRTGRGQSIDGSQVESAILFYATAILEYTANDKVRGLQGNWVPEASPHNIYKCSGDERWVAVCVYDEKEWNAFCTVIGNPSWTTLPKFATLEDRKQNEAELDELVEKWTLEHTPEHVMEKMQAAGIAAGVVKNGKELFDDLQLEHRKQFWSLEHAEVGNTKGSNPSYKLSETPAKIHMPPPCLGEHTEKVCREILGLNDEEFIELLVDGALN